MKKVLLFIFVLLAAQVFSQECTPSVSLQIDGSECISQYYNFSFRAIPVNGGTAPSYQWEKNGVVYDDGYGYSGPYAPQSYSGWYTKAGDIIKCTMTSNADCASPKTAIATHVIAYVNGKFPTTLSVSPLGSVYQGTSVLFHGFCNNDHGNSRYYYMFYVNGKMVPTYEFPSDGYTGSSDFYYSTDKLKDGDVVYAVTLRNVNGNPCADTTISNSIKMSVISVLPLTLSQFNVKSLGDKFLLNWTTATETNTDNFNVQVSTDGISFIDVGKVKAAGSSTTLQSYNYTCQPTSFSNETYYFRLKTDDKDGRYTMSPIRSSSLFGDFQVTISPNPAKDIVNVKGAAIKQVQLFDLSGKLLVDKTTSSNNASIDVSNISRGIYLLRITNTNDKIQVQKIVLQ